MGPITSSQFQKFDTISHGFFTREGGVSEGNYASLNCGLNTDDKPGNIQKNLEIIRSKICPSADLYLLKQIHSNLVVTLDKKSENIGVEGDAFVTNQKNQIISIMTADCVPILFYDPANQIIAAAHAGWRGAYSGIIQNTVHSMIKLGAKAEQIMAAIGPSILQDAYQVGDEFYKTFLEQSPKNERFFIKKNESFYFDVRAYCRQQLLFSNVQKIDDLPGQGHDFFSYRKNPNSGRQISSICLL